MRTILALVLSIPLLAVALPSSSEGVTDYDRFQLWTGCEPIDLLVGNLYDNALSIGLQRDDIQNDVRSRLQAAQIYNSDPVPTSLTFDVGIIVLGDSFFIRLLLWKMLFDPNSEKTSLILAWHRSSAGTHAGEADNILSDISKYTDEFIDEYLRVNAEACN